MTIDLHTKTVETLFCLTHTFDPKGRRCCSCAANAPYSMRVTITSMRPRDIGNASAANTAPCRHASARINYCRGFWGRLRIRGWAAPISSTWKAVLMGSTNCSSLYEAPIGFWLARRGEARAHRQLQQWWIAAWVMPNLANHEPLLEATRGMRRTCFDCSCYPRVTSPAHRSRTIQLAGA